MEEIDLSEELQDFYEKNKHEKSIRNWEETLKKSKGFLSSNFLKFNVIGNGINPESKIVFTSINSNDEFIFSFRQDVILVYKTYFLFRGSSIYNNQIFYKINYSNYGDVEIDYKKTLGKEYPILKCKKQDFYSDSMIQDDHLRLFNEFDFIIKKRLKEEENIKEDKLKEQERLKEQKRLKELQISQTNVLSELDKDGNGEVDVVEGNDFNTLLKKHQKSIVEVDRTYVQQFVKVSSYLKTKKGNIQSIFNSIKDTPNQEVLNEYVEILKDDIHTYNLILFNSLNMIVSLVEDDMITFYEIHEMFDTLNMFDSKHEKDVSQKLTNIGDGLKDLMYEVRRMGNKISNSIQELSYVTEESNRQLTNQLSEIDSTMKVGNLINTINTYQNYKTNRRLNS